MVADQSLFLAGVCMLGGFACFMFFLVFYMEWGRLERREVITGMLAIIFTFIGSVLIYRTNSSGTPLNFSNMNKWEYLTTVCLLAYGIFISGQYSIKLEFNEISDTDTGRNVSIVVLIIFIIVFVYMVYKMFGWS